MPLQVDTTQLREGCSALSSLASETRTVALKANYISARIDMLGYESNSGSPLHAIGRNVSRIADELTTASKTVYSLSDTLNSISDEYIYTEKKICNPNIYRAVRAFDPSIINEFLNHEPLKFEPITKIKSSSDQDKKHLKSVYDLYKLMTGLYGQLIGDLEGNGWKLGGALFSFFGIFLSAKSNDAPRNRLELFRQFESMMGSEVSLLGKLVKLFKQNELSSAYGIAGSGLSIVSELSKFAGYNVPEALKKMGGLIDKGGDLGKNIFDAVHGNDIGYNTKTVKNTNRDNLAAVKAMFSMGTYFTGDVMERSADGMYDIKDYGGTLLETGINGMSSVVRSYTAGIVNLDASRATTIYNGVTDRVTDWIKSTNAPLPVQTAMAVPGTVVSASVSTVAVFIDHGMQIGEKINNVISWFRKK